VRIMEREWLAKPEPDRFAQNPSGGSLPKNG
jgi:hypothetical protein